MKRSLVFCAIALVAVAANSALATVNVQLNLRYDNPGDESQGGSYELLVLSGGDGVTGIVAAVDNINNDAAAAGTGTSGYDVFQSQQIGTAVEIVAGDDLTAPLSGVGTSGGPNAGQDDLFTGNSAWDNSALIASGTFGAARPSFTTIGAINSTTAANTIDGSSVVAAATLGTLSVRGDGVASDGLLPGDANRDGSVGAADVSALSGGFGTAGGWDEGNFTGGATIGAADVSTLSGNFNGTSASPGTAPVLPLSAAGSVPEPTSVVLVGLGLSMLGLGRRRS